MAGAARGQANRHEFVTMRRPPTGASQTRAEDFGEVAERLKAHAWKVCIRQKRIEGSNPSLSATTKLFINKDLLVIQQTENPAIKAAILSP